MYGGDPYGVDMYGEITAFTVAQALQASTTPVAAQVRGRGYTQALQAACAPVAKIVKSTQKIIGGRTNFIRNSTMVGAVAGTPGTLPTNWSGASGLSGISRTIALGSINGVPYMDVTLSGTASSTFSLYQNFEGNTVIPATAAQTWTFSTSLAIVSGVLNGATIGLGSQRLATGAVGLGDASVAVTGLTSTLQRFPLTFANGPYPTIVNVMPYMSWTFTSGQTYNFTMRIYTAQMEPESQATPFIPTSGSFVTVYGASTSPVASLTRAIALPLQAVTSPVASLARAFAKIFISRTNLLSFSHDPTNVAWSVPGINAPALLAAGGPKSDAAYRISHKSGSFQYPFYGTNVTTGTGAYTVAVILRYVNTQWVWIRGDDVSGGYPVAAFDVQNGVLGGTALIGASGSAIYGSTITALGGGWYLCTLTYSLVGALTGNGNLVIRAGTGTTPTNNALTYAGTEQFDFAGAGFTPGYYSTADIVTASGGLTTPGGSTAPVASLARSTHKLLQAITSPVASVRRATGKLLQASTTPVASVVRGIVHRLQVTTTPVSALARGLARLLQATTSPVAALRRSTNKRLQVQTTPVATATRQTNKPLQASTTPAGALLRGMVHRLQAVTTPVASLATAFGAGFRAAWVIITRSIRPS